MLLQDRLFINNLRILFMKIAFIASEVTPFSKTGGLADVAGSLPKELKSLDNEIILFTPKYSTIDENKFGLVEDKSLGDIHIPIGDNTHSAKIFKSTLPGSSVEIYFVDSPRYFSRDSFYTNDPDEDERFIFFSIAVIKSVLKLNFDPDIIHCNDWHTGLIPALIKENYRYNNNFLRSTFIFTIHNIAFHGTFKKETLVKSGLNEKLFFPLSPFEFYGKISFLKAGISYSDIISTVSETYAKEILTPEFGAGLEGVLLQRKDNLVGILNGVDYDEWSPVNDKLIPHNYSIDNLAGKELNKKYLLNHFGIPYKKDIPLIGFIARLTDQKGFDIISEALDELLNLNAQWIFLGSGEPEYEELLKETAVLNKNKFAVHIGFNNELAHLIEAGSDMFLMPSRFEPCGLNQIYSLKYGTVPIVHKTGGLADTIIDWNDNNKTGTGFVFDKHTAANLFKTIKRAISLFAENDSWIRIMSNGMGEEFSWNASAKKYVGLYENAIAKHNN